MEIEILINRLVIRVQKMLLKLAVVFFYLCAYLCNKVVTVDFQVAFSAVTVNVINETTGETVYSELFTNPASFSIDLNGRYAGEYIIEIVSDGMMLEGDFKL